MVCLARTSSYTGIGLDSKLKLPRLNLKNPKKNQAARLKALRREYQALTRQLSQIGYISQGSVLDRSTLRRPRSGYQWTRKLARKTITVALSAEQFVALQKAISNRRALEKTIAKMEKLSRRILFETTPDTARRKQLSKKVLGTV